MRIAMISEHASPLTTVGGVGAGGQSAHVAGLSTALAGLGHDVRVYTRRDAPGLPSMVKMIDGRGGRPRAGRAPRRCCRRTRCFRT